MEKNWIENVYIAFERILDINTEFPLKIVKKKDKMLELISLRSYRKYWLMWDSSILSWIHKQNKLVCPLIASEKNKSNNNIYAKI